MGEIKFIIVIVTVILVNSTLYSGNKVGILIGDKINLREQPTIKSKSLGLLNKNAKITIIKDSSEFVLINKYYGRWLKIKTKYNKTGYLLSCFVNSELENDEKFHLFYTKFFNSFVGGKTNFYKRRVKYPLNIKEYHTEGEQTYKITSHKEIRSLLACTSEMPEFTIENKKIKVHFDCNGNGQGRVWFFALISKKWHLVYAELYEY